MKGKPSFRKFDYRLRPAKCVERKMFCEAFHQLSSFAPLESYRYIGFGSTTFSDFSIIHKTLAVKDMISIEKRISYDTRFEFNKPFQCIEMKFGHSNKVLPELSWNKKTIIWLDYEGHLTSSELRDVAYIAMNAVSGSMLAVTLYVGNYKIDEESKKELGLQGARLKKLNEDVGSEKIPGDIKGKHVEGIDLAYTFRRIVINEINQVLRDRNSYCSAEQHMTFAPLFHFHYSDQAKMLTIGGLLYSKEDETNFHKCRFEKFYFVSQDETPFKINVPILTPREQRYLDKKLPQGAVNEAIDMIGLTENEINDYARIYRYSPQFVEVDLY